MTPMPECPADRDGGQVGDKNRLDRAGLLEVVRVNGRHDCLAEIELHKDLGRIEIVEYDFRFQLHATFERRLLDGAVMRRASGKPQVTDAVDILQLQPLVSAKRIRL